MEIENVSDVLVPLRCLLLTVFVVLTIVTAAILTLVLLRKTVCVVHEYTNTTSDHSDRGVVEPTNERMQRFVDRLKDTLGELRIMRKSEARLSERASDSSAEVGCQWNGSYPNVEECMFGPDMSVHCVREQIMRLEDQSGEDLRLIIDTIAADTQEQPAELDVIFADLCTEFDLGRQLPNLTIADIYPTSNDVELAMEFDSEFSNQTELAM